MKNNAFGSTFSQVKESKPKTVDSVTSQQEGVDVKDKMSTKQQVAKLTRQHSNKSTIKMIEADSIPVGLERKTFHLKSEFLEMFKYAKFKTLQEMKEWKKENLLEAGECLFISPLSDEDKFNLETENELSEKRKGGYICALWKK